jgi:hypothetical protein
MILSLAYKYGLKMDYRVHKIHQISPHYLRLGLMNAYTAGNLPDRETYTSFRSFRRHEDTYIGKAYSHGLNPYSMKIYRLDQTMLCVQRYKYVFCSKRVWLTQISSRPIAKSSSSKKYIGPASQQWSVIFKDRMPRSNGVVKNLASYKTFSDEIKDQRLVLKAT